MMSCLPIAFCLGVVMKLTRAINMVTFKRLLYRSAITKQLTYYILTPEGGQIIITIANCTLFHSSVGKMYKFI